MKKVLLISLLIAAASGAAWSQTEKPGCNPKACGPTDTKLGEARAVSELRESLQLVLSDFGTKAPDLKARLQQINISPGADDEASVQTLVSASETLRKTLLTQLPSDRLLAELRSYQPVAAASGKDAVVRLRKDLEIFQTQLASL